MVGIDEPMLILAWTSKARGEGQTTKIAGPRDAIQLRQRTKVPMAAIAIERSTKVTATSRGDQKRHAGAASKARGDESDDENAGDHRR